MQQWRKLFLGRRDIKWITDWFSWICVGWSNLGE